MPSENNFVINARHPAFPQVKVKHKEPFIYDYRFINIDQTLIKKKREKK